MNNREILDKYYYRLSKEGIVKSVIMAFIVGLGISTIAALISYFVNYSGLWLSIGICITAVAVFSPLFYYLKFRPTAKQLAKRLDALGLEERVVTMLELEKEESYIAALQRQDAHTKLGTVDTKQLKWAIFKLPIVMLIVALAACVSMTTVSATSVTPKIGWEYPQDKPFEDYQYVRVIYLSEQYGFIEGAMDQLVASGQDATAVRAVAHDGFVFEKWSDGVTTAERTDRNMLKNYVVVAIYKEDDGANLDKENDREGSGDEGDTESGGGGKDRYEEINYIINGETYYRDRYEEFYNEIMRILAESEEVPPYLRSIIERYFGIII